MIEFSSVSTGSTGSQMRERPAVIVVVAHPDDESIWIGGTLLRMRDAGFRLFIVCATGKSNPVRAPEFLSACLMLRATPILLDHVDGRNAPIANLADELSEVGNAVLQECSEILCVLTHPPHGNAHRHPQHLDCFKHVQRWARGHHIPFGVFSERLADDLRHEASFGTGADIEFCAVSPDWTGPVRGLLDVARAKADQSYLRPAPKPVSAVERARAGDASTTSAVKHMPVLARLANRIASLKPFWNAVAALSIEVDSSEKQVLCDLHVSQIAGLKEYLAYQRNREFVYLDNAETARRLEKMLREARPLRATA
ncbi:MAG TPA: PIG-L family deacetylase [Bradyrhizobium sp.]|nr:PIG-L family deacetylase [Bradyrhizobium sp.]